MAIRMALLAHHYRSDWEWTDAVLGDAQARLARWRAALARTEAAVELAVRQVTAATTALLATLPPRQQPPPTLPPLRRIRKPGLPRSTAGLPGAS